MFSFDQKAVYTFGNWYFLSGSIVLPTKEESNAHRLLDSSFVGRTKQYESPPQNYILLRQNYDYKTLFISHVKAESGQTANDRRPDSARFFPFTVNLH